jgi:hypothetical protein
LLLLPQALQHPLLLLPRALLLLLLPAWRKGVAAEGKRVAAAGMTSLKIQKRWNDASGDEECLQQGSRSSRCSRHKHCSD